MEEPVELSSLECDFDLDTFLNSIPPDFDFGVGDGVFMDAPLVDDGKSPEYRPGLELPEVFDPLQEPAAPDVGLEFPEVAVESPVVSTGSGSPHGSDSFWAEELERFLLQDDDGPTSTVATDDGFFLHEFFADVGFEERSVDVDVPVKPVGPAGRDVAAVLDPATPGSCASATPHSILEEEVEEEDEEEEEGPRVDNNNSMPERRMSGNDEDALEKKRRRQLRNRDSALKSRERRKLYIQDLEKKSKTLEMECRRLEHLLYCSAAENHALHQRLQRDRTLGSLTAKQESAVLFVELLLLGSLFWLVNLEVLFLVPNLLAQGPKLVPATERARDVVRNPVLVGIAGARKSGCSRKYSALRTKMKILLVFSAA